MKILSFRCIRPLLILSLAGLMLLSTGTFASSDVQAFGSLTENGTAAFMGIGINPTKILHVAGTGPGSVPLFQRGTDSAGFIIERTPTNRWVLGVNESPTLGNGFVLSTIPVGTTSVPRLLVMPDGRVTIGTLLPASWAKLAVYSDNTTNGNVAIGGQTTGGNTAAVGGRNDAARTLGLLGYRLNGYGGGVYGQNDNASSWGFLAGMSSQDNSGIGAYGQNDSRGTYGGLGAYWNGVYGLSPISLGPGVWGGNSADNGTGVYGYTWGRNTSGIMGYCDNTSSAGVYGVSTSSGSVGIQGLSTASNASAVFGESYNSGGYGIYGKNVYGGPAGYFEGPVTVTGTLTKPGGSFRIDHPLDPANKYLQHSFVESPDMKNVYDGNAVLDSKGEAVVQLPDYFESLNKDFRYQLTCIGGYAPVYIAEKISGNSFKIAGGKAGLEVSWQVTGTRQDPWAAANPIVVELEKRGGAKGTFLNPELYKKSSTLPPGVTFGVPGQLSGMRGPLK